MCTDRDNVQAHAPFFPSLFHPFFLLCTWTASYPLSLPENPISSFRDAWPLAFSFWAVATSTLVVQVYGAYCEAITFGTQVSGYWDLGARTKWTAVVKGACVDAVSRNQ